MNFVYLPVTATTFPPLLKISAWAKAKVFPILMHSALIRISSPTLQGDKQCWDNSIVVVSLLVSSTFKIESVVEQSTIVARAPPWTTPKKLQRFFGTLY